MTHDLPNNICITLPQAAEHLSVSYGTAKRWAVSGTLPGAFKIGGIWRVNRAALENASLGAQAAPDAEQPSAI